MTSIHVSPWKRAQANLLAASGSLLILSCAHGEISPHPSQEPKPTNPVSLREVEAGVFELGKLRFDKNQRSVTLPATVNQIEGILEYLLVHKEGKLHESVFSTEVEPYQLHAVMLLLGAKGTPSKEASENSAPLQGDPIQISVQWEFEGKRQVCRGEELIFDQQNNTTMQHPGWIYTGSFFFNGTFAAQSEKSILAIIEDPLALITTQHPRKENYGNWIPHKAKLPSLGTPVHITIQLIHPASKTPSPSIQHDNTTEKESKTTQPHKNLKKMLH